MRSGLILTVSCKIHFPDWEKGSRRRRIKGNKSSGIRSRLNFGQTLLLDMINLVMEVHYFYKRRPFPCISRCMAHCETIVISARNPLSEGVPGLTSKIRKKNWQNMAHILTAKRPSGKPAWTFSCISRSPACLKIAFQALSDLASRM